MDQAISFLKNFINTLIEKRIAIASLRYKPYTKEMAFSGDYDFITDPKNIDDILKTLFEMATALKINFTINRIKYGKVMISLYNKDDSQSILLEIWTHLDIKYKKSLGYIFWDDIKRHITFTKEKGYILSLELESLYYLSHLKSKNKDLDTPLIQERLRYYRDALYSDKSEYLNLYSDLLDDTSNLENIAIKANELLIEKGVLFRREDKDKSSIEKQLRLKKSLHRIYSQLLYKLKIIPVVGPDGVGKTSIIKAIKLRSKSKIRYYRFKNLFRHNFLYQFSMPYLKAKLKKKVEKNQFDDIYGTWIITIAWLRFPLLVMKNLLIGGFYFSDRFFHDFILKDTRFLEKKAKLRENWKALLDKTPNSFWFIHLDAPTDVILSRKDELNREAIDTYREDIFKMYLEKPSLVYSYINTSVELEFCIHPLMDTSKLIGMK